MRESSFGPLSPAEREFFGEDIDFELSEIPEEEIKDSTEKTKPFDLKFYTTDHSPDFEDTGNPDALRNLYTDIKKDGITSVRYDWRWNKTEPKPEKFEDAINERYTNALEIMHETGLESPTIVLSSIPDWALELYKTDKEKFFAEYKVYLEHVKKNLVEASEKTGTLVERFQVLNELNNTVYTPIAATDIPRLCHITREVLADYNPNMKLVGTVFAGNLPEVIKKATFGTVNLGTPIDEFLAENESMLREFDTIAIDYYPGMWHIPLTEARENKKEIFKQLGLLQKTMETIASWGVEYELGEVGIQTNIPGMSASHNEDRQRYFYDVFFKAFKHMLLDFQKNGTTLPTSVGLYQAADEAPRSLVGKILRKVTPFPEHDMGMRKKDLSRKEILLGNRHKQDRGASQLSKIVRYMNTPVIKK